MSDLRYCRSDSKEQNVLDRAFNPKVISILVFIALLVCGLLGIVLVFYGAR